METASLLNSLIALPYFTIWAALFYLSRRYDSAPLAIASAMFVALYVADEGLYQLDGFGLDDRGYDTAWLIFAGIETGALVILWKAGAGIWALLVLSASIIYQVCRVHLAPHSPLEEILSEAYLYVYPIWLLGFVVSLVYRARLDFDQRVV